MKNSAAKTLSRMLVSLARYVNSVAAGDVEMAVSSGFELERRRDPIDKLEAPARMEAHSGLRTGEVDLRWKPVRGARMYIVYICNGDPLKDGEWRALGYSAKARFTVTGLERHQNCAFRVTALGRTGEGPASEIVTAEAA